VASIEGEMHELKLRNISSMGALVECGASVAPGAQLTIDIIGVGPVRGLIRWAQEGKFGVQFVDQFDLARLAPKKERSEGQADVLKPWYVERRAS
jgi:hypothetical protein